MENRNFYIFEVIDGKNRLGGTMSHWCISNTAKSKKEIMDYYNTKGYARKVKYVYTSEEFVKSFTNKRAIEILKDALCK